MLKNVNSLKILAHLPSFGIIPFISPFPARAYVKSKILIILIMPMETLDTLEKEKYLKSMDRKFKFWAPFYDLAFFLQTVGRTSQVRKALTDKVAIKEGKILDVCTGTGTVATLLAKKLPRAEVIGFDLSESMMAVGRRKAEKMRVENVKFLQGDAQKMPFEDGSFDVVINSFGFHEMPLEITHQVTREMSRVLKPGGQLILMDYQRPKNFLLRIVFDLIMVVFEPRDTFIYCQEGLTGCIAPIREFLKEVNIEDCYETSQILSAIKA